MKYCMYCGTENNEDAAFCSKCGKSTQITAAEPVQPEPQHIHIHHEYVQPEPKPSRKNGLGVAGFVLSLISIVLSVIPIVGLIALITDIPAFCLGLAGLLKGVFKKKKLGLSITALILSIIAFIIMMYYVKSIASF